MNVKIIHKRHQIIYIIIIMINIILVISFISILLLYISLQFSNNTNVFTAKEGLTVETYENIDESDPIFLDKGEDLFEDDPNFIESVPTTSTLSTISDPTDNTIEVPLPIITNKNYSIVTEGNFIDFIIGMNSIILTGMQNSQNISATIQNKKEINTNAMILIANYAPILKGINSQPFNVLSTAYPNIVTTSYDVQKINEMYYSAMALNQSISKLQLSDTSIVLTDPKNYHTYNALLSYLNTFSECINYFYNLYINPPIREIKKVEDNWNTTIYT